MANYNIDAIYNGGTSLPGTERIRIDSSGNIGIGTASPAYKLDVNGEIGVGGLRFLDLSTNYFRIFEPAGNIAIYLGNAADPSNYFDNTNHVFRNRGGSSVYALINSNGNLGIGTTSPTTKLAVSDGTTIAQVNPSSNVAYFGTVNNYPMALSVNSSEKVRVDTNGNVGIGTTSPNKKLQVIGSLGKGINLYEVPIDNLAASATQAKRFEIARVFIDYNDWNQTGALEIEARESYYSDGRYKRYVFSYGYNSSNVGSLWLVEDSGRGANDFKAEVGSAVQISGDIYYVPIYIDLDYYQYVDVLVRTNRVRTTNASSSSGGVIYINESPTGSNISSFSPDEVAYISLASSKTYLGYSGNVGVGTSPSYKLDVNGITRFQNIIRLKNDAWNLTDADGQSRFYFDYNGRTYFGSANGYEWRSSSDSILAVLTNGGNVGIGTSSPAYKLEVNGNFAASGGSAFGNTYPQLTLNGTTNQHAYLMINRTNYEAGIQFQTSGITKWWMYMPSGSDASLRFYTNQNSSGDIFNITNTGNVGISTTSPNTKLEVYGVVRITESASGGILQMQAGSSALDFASTYYGGTYRPFTFTNGGSERMRIQSDGNVGIGTSSPSQLLEVNGSSPIIRVLATSGNATLRLTDNGVRNWDLKVVDTSDYFEVGGTNATSLVVVGTGNVGIGTTAPSQKFEVVGGEIKAGRVDSNEEGGQVSFGRASDNATGWYIDVYGSTSTPQLRFVDVSNSSVRMVINQSGNLGIGTTSPTTKLEVIGDIAAFANGADTITRGVYIANAANTRAFNFQLNSGGTNLDLWSYNSAGAWVRRVSFNYDGNVGIGTTAPSSTLYVSGNVGISGNITKGGGSFLIEHPDPAKQGWKLQHSFVESPTVGDNIYRYEITINETLQGAIELPNYWKHLNENPQIWINPVNHFGIAYGEINEDISRLTVFANSVGKYNILLIGTRKDPTIKKIMADFAVERKPE